VCVAGSVCAEGMGSRRGCVRSVAEVPVQGEGQWGRGVRVAGVAGKGVRQAAELPGSGMARGRKSAGGEILG